MLRILLLATFLGALTLIYFKDPIYSYTMTSYLTTPWSSPFASWHFRSLLTPHPSPHTFTPTRQSLLLAVLLNSPVEHEGISLTLYSDSGATGETVAIDARGRVLYVSERDAAGMLALAEKTLELPRSERWWNTWVVEQPRTSQLIHRVFIPSQDKSFKEVSVQGFSKETRALQTPVGMFQQLPNSLWELVGLVLEATEGDHEDRDHVVLEKVREIVKDLF